MIPPVLFIFLKIALAFQGLLLFHINFNIICSSPLKNVMGILIGIALKSVDCSGLYGEYYT